MAKQKIIFVLPIQSPYTTPRLEALAQYDDLEVVLLLEQDAFHHRPGWQSVPISGCTVEILGSQVISSNTYNKNFDYEYKRIRSIPWRLPIVLWRRRPDVVIVCNGTQLLLAALVRPLRHFKVALNVEDTLHSMHHRSRISCWLKAFVYRRADLHFAFSRMAEGYLRSIGLDRTLRRTSWSVNIASFCRKPAPRYQKRSELGVGERILFFYAGQLIPRKGVMLMLRAWASLPVEVRDQATLVLAGEGPLKYQARQFIVEHKLDEIQFLGNVPYSNMPDYFAAADVFILPTLEDLFSLVVVEAMASGCVVLTSPYNGASELVEENKTGWLFDPIDEHSFREGLLRAIQARDRLQAMGKAATARVQSLDTSVVMNKLRFDLKSIR